VTVDLAARIHFADADRRVHGAEFAVDGGEPSEAFAVSGEGRCRADLAGANDGMHSCLALRDFLRSMGLNAVSTE